MDNEPIYQLIDDTKQKYTDGNCIYDMHHLQVKAGRPVWIFFAEKVHRQIYVEKEKSALVICD